MKISRLLVMLVIIGSLAIGVTSFHGAVNTQYGGNSTDVSYINATSSLNERLEEMQESTRTNLGSDSALDVIFALPAGAINAVITSFAFVDIFTILVSDVSTLLLIPSWLSGMILIIASITVLSAVLYLLLKVQW